MGESLLYCAERETLEETGLKVKGIKVIAVTNDVFDAENKHYVTIFVQCEREDGSAQPQVCSIFSFSHSSLHLILGTPESTALRSRVDRRKGFGTGEVRGLALGGVGGYPTVVRTSR